MATSSSWNLWHSTDLPGTDQTSAYSPGDMAETEMKSSHFPSIPFVASRDPTMARCRVQHVSIGTLEASCHRSDSRSRNSSDPFPELFLQERIIQVAVMVSTLFWNFHTSSSSHLYGRLIDLSLSVMVTTTTTQHYGFPGQHHNSSQNLYSCHS